MGDTLRGSQHAFQRVSIRFDLYRHQLLRGSGPSSLSKCSNAPYIGAIGRRKGLFVRCRASAREGDLAWGVPQLQRTVSCALLKQDGV
jgi:hypothetical protein